MNYKSIFTGFLYCVMFVVFGAFLFAYYYSNKDQTMMEETYTPFEMPERYKDMNVNEGAINLDTTEISTIYDIDVSVSDSKLLSQITPLVVLVIESRGGKSVMSFDKKYDLKVGSNRMQLDISSFCDTFMIQIGYFLYEELYSDKPKRFFCKKYNIVKGENKKSMIEDPEMYNTILRYDTIPQIRRDTFFHKIYVYEYDMDAYFKGFKDANDSLLNGYNNIKLNNRSTYQGYMKKGLFEGKGTFCDSSFLYKEYKGFFKEGRIVSFDTISANQFKRIVDIPLLSKSYPIGSVYKTEALFVNNINIERVFHVYEANGKGYREILRFDKNGNMKERVWEGMSGYYYNDGGFVLGIMPVGGKKSIGVHRIEFSFDKQGGVRWEKYFDNNNQLIREGNKGVVGDMPLFNPLRINDIQ